jgi:hypothetical protein
MGFTNQNVSINAMKIHIDNRHVLTGRPDVELPNMEMVKTFSL